MSPELLKKMQDGRRSARERGEREAAQAKAAATAAPPEEPPPEIMPTLDDDVPGPAEDEIAISEPPTGGMFDPFERFLADLDSETRELLTEEDGSVPQLRAIFEAEVKKAKEARREVAKKQAAARASRHAKTDAGLIAPEDAASAALQRRMNRKVTWTVEMAKNPNGHLIDEGYRIDGRLYGHGETVTGTYGEWLSYIEMVYRARNSEMDFEGKGLLNEHRRLSTGALSVTLGGRAA